MSVVRAVELSLKGWQIVAGGPQTTGSLIIKGTHAGGVQDFCHAFSVRTIIHGSGGLRFATTTGYFLKRLRREETRGVKHACIRGRKKLRQVQWRRRVD